MRFTCDSCSAQYMISDDKVGPNGVKVRCKKCGHVILVRRPPEEPVGPPAAEEGALGAGPETGVPGEGVAPSGAAGPPAGDGLDEELGQAFDKVMGGGSADPQVPVSPEPSGTFGASAASSPEPSAPAGAPGAAGPSTASEWYVAIDEQQVGPMPADDVKARWEAGAVGPDSLVWCAGMADWAPLSSVAELAGYLAPFPRADRNTRATRVAAAGPGSSAGGGTGWAGTAGASAGAGGTSPAGAGGGAPGAATGGEPSAWKPGAAHALATLASEEIAAMRGPGPAADAGGARGRLLESMDLPDAGGVDPTGAIPLPIKGLERTGEKKLSSVARTTAEIRIKRSANRTILVVAAVLLAVFGAGAAALYSYFDRKLEAQGTAVAAQQPPPAPAVQTPFGSSSAPPASPAAAAAPQAVAAVPATGAPGSPAADAAGAPAAGVAPAAGGAAPVAGASAPGPTPPGATGPGAAVAAGGAAGAAPVPPAGGSAAAPPAPAPAAPAAAAAPEPAAPAPKVAASKAAPKKKGKPEPKPAATKKQAAARPAPPAVASAEPAASSAKKKTGDPLLDASDVDAAFERELQGGGGGGAKRSVYVPPAPGSDLPEKLSESQIQEGVASRIDALKQCVATQQAQNPDVHGTLTLQWTIQGDGSVTAVKAKSPELAGQPIVGCVANVVKTIRFPRSRTSGQPVSFPFGF